MEIKREAYLEQLKIRKDNGMIKVITGIRRCGKSFLLFVLFKKMLGSKGGSYCKKGRECSLTEFR